MTGVHREGMSILEQRYRYIPVGGGLAGVLAEG